MPECDSYDLVAAETAQDYLEDFVLEDGYELDEINQYLHDVELEQDWFSFYE